MGSGEYLADSDFFDTPATPTERIVTPLSAARRSQSDGGNDGGRRHTTKGVRGGGGRRRRRGKERGEGAGEGVSGSRMGQGWLDR